VGTTCPNSTLLCNKLTTSTCADPDSCTAADYAKPTVQIGQLPGASAQLSTQLSWVKPIGATPTSAALQGAIDYAKSYAMPRPTHTVAVVLATDGLPTECAPTDINNIAAIAAKGLAGTPSIKTFVIGVFAPSETSAPTNLNKIAAAGGTTKAYMVDTTQNVAQAFFDALNAVRATKLACEYEIPPPPEDAGTLDFDRVNVEYTKSGTTTPVTIPYVPTGVAGCDATTGGWYYDADPTKGGVPTKIVMCPSTCTTFQQDTGGQIDIRLGCKTVVAPPK
jgi:hypothetical protein